MSTGSCPSSPGSPSARATGLSSVSLFPPSLLFSPHHYHHALRPLTHPPVYASNYLVHSYSIYAASALAGNAVLRSILGATLPLAGPALYARLGPNWAGTLLGLLEAICIPCLLYTSPSPRD